MTSVELKYFYSQLRQQKDAENKAHEDSLRAAKEAKRQASAAKSMRPRRR